MNIPDEAVEAAAEWLRVFAGLGLMFVTVLACLALLVFGMAAIQKRGMK